MRPVRADVAAGLSRHPARGGIKPPLLILLFAALPASAQFSTTFGWNPLGPSGVSTRVLAVVADPRDTSTLLFASPGGGVWRSTNGGSDWSALTDAAATQQICSLAMDPNNPDKLYAGTGDERSPRPGPGVLRSLDGGKTWTMAQGFSTRPVCAVAVDPQDGKRVLAGSTDGIFRSTDSGQTWTRVSTVAAQNLAYSPAANGIVYAAAASADFFNNPSASSPLLRSTDAGATWTPVTVPAGQPANPRTLNRAAVAVGDAGVVYLALSYQEVNASFVDLYSSSDGGVAWNTASRATSGGGQVALLYDGTNRILYLGAGLPLRVTPDFQSLTSLATGPSNINSLALLSGAVIAASDTGLTSVPLNRTPTSALPLPSIGQFLYVNSDPTNTSITYAGSNEGLEILPPLGLWQKAISTPIGPMQAVPTSPVNVYAMGNTSFYRSTDAGATFKAFMAIAAGEFRAPFPPLLVDTINSALLFTAGQKVYRSMDGGQTWAAISAALEPGTFNVVVTLAFAPAVRQTMYAATACLPDVAPAGTRCAAASRIFRSTNGGVTWQQVSVVDGLVNRIVVDPRVAFQVYVTVGAYPGGPSTTAGLLSGQLLRSRDGAVTWEDIRSNLPDTLFNTLVIDPQFTGLFFQPATTLYVGTDLGVFATFNSGLQWVAINSGLPNVPVTDLNLRQPNSFLRAATFGRGIFQARGDRISSALAIVPLGTTVSVVQGQSAVVNLALANNSSSGADWNLTTRDPWLAASPASGHIDPLGSANIQLTITTSSLAAGSYRTQVRVNELWPDGSVRFSQDFLLSLRVTMPPAKLLAVSGNGATGAPGSAVTLVVQALDADGNPLSNLNVQFRITSGSGQLNPPNAVTDTQGRAGSTLTLPSSAGTVRVAATAAGLTATFTLTVVKPLAPSLNSGAAVNAASYVAGGSLAPGSIVAIFGTELSGATAAAAEFPLPTALAGASVGIGSVPAPLFFVSPQQVNVLVPFDVSFGASTLRVEVQTPLGNVTSNEIEVNLAPAAPGIFSLSADGRGAGLFFKGDSSLVSAQNPARRGALVTFYATGLGAVDPPVISGNPASAGEPLNRTVVMPTVSVGGQEATVQYSGLAPGFVGLYQINILIPQTVTPGSNVPVNLRIGTAISNTVTLPVQ